MNFRRALFWLIPLLPVVAAETFSYVWMNPKAKEAYLYPTLPQPFADRTFKSTPEQFEKIKGILHCSQGWLGAVGAENTATTQLAWIEWNDTKTISTLEAFAHKPEVCMRAARGMKLEQSYPPRVYGSGEQKFIFDSTRFRPLHGGPSFYVFKAVWVSGLPGSSLRSDLFQGISNQNGRAVRVAIATRRFKPEKTRVLMAGVGGWPSEEMAWKSFSREILPQIQWTTVQPSSEN